MNSTEIRELARTPSSAPGLASIRQALLMLHRALLQAERLRYERVHGRVSAGSFLEAVVYDEDLAWLAPLTALVVQLDELIDVPDAHADDVAACLAQLQRLLQPDCQGEGFARHYGELLERSPDAVLAHGSFVRSLA